MSLCGIICLEFVSAKTNTFRGQFVDARLEAYKFEQGYAVHFAAIDWKSNYCCVRVSYVAYSWSKL